MIRICIDEVLVVRGLASEDETRWRDRVRFLNPKYAASARYTRDRKPSRNIQPTIALGGHLLDGGLLLPRGVLADLRVECPDAALDDRTACPSIHLQTSGALVPRDYQRDAVEAVVRARSGVVVAGTGTGKTCIALHLAERLQTPTLILVHTGTLLAQTAARMREMLGIEPGIIGDGTWEPRAVTVGMVQTLSSRGAGDLADRFGCVIQDEAHHVPAETFANVAQQFRARYRVGLTATPTRSDGLEPILFAVIGPIVYRLVGTSLPLRYTRVDTGWTCDPLPQRRNARRSRPGFRLDNDQVDDLDYVELLNRLCADAARSALIVDTIDREHWGVSLVLTERVAHAHTLAESLCARGLRAAALAGPVNTATRDGVVGELATGRLDVLVSTRGMVGEGFDCPRIDTLFLAAPHGLATAAEQTAGRTTRPYPGKAFGRVVDFVDGEVKPLLGQWFKRAKVYKRLAGAKS
jgi:superfamily II DNA or RNA helicase